MELHRFCCLTTDLSVFDDFDDQQTKWGLYCNGVHLPGRLHSKREVRCYLSLTIEVPSIDVDILLFYIVSTSTVVVDAGWFFNPASLYQKFTAAGDSLWVATVGQTIGFNMLSTSAAIDPNTGELASFWVGSGSASSPPYDLDPSQSVTLVTGEPANQFWSVLCFSWPGSVNSLASVGLTVTILTIHHLADISCCY